MSHRSQEHEHSHPARPAAATSGAAWFHRFAANVSTFTGSPVAFVTALGLVVIWLVTGPLFRFSDPWQLVINTGTTIVTFLMVFLIQSQQNRDARVLHLKLDELLRAVHNARDELIDLEHCTDEELDRFEHEFRRVTARRATRGGGPR